MSASIELVSTTQSSIQVRGRWSGAATAYYAKWFIDADNGSKSTGFFTVSNRSSDTRTFTYSNNGSLGEQMSPGTTYKVYIRYYGSNQLTDVGTAIGFYTTNSPPVLPGPVTINGIVQGTTINIYGSAGGNTNEVRVSSTLGVQTVAVFNHGTYQVAFQGVQETSYTFYAWGRNANGDGPTSRVDVYVPKIQKPRPSNWSWSVSKSKGQSYSIVNGRFTNLVTYNEIINFQNRIAEFREYKGMSVHTFYPTPRGSVLNVDMYNSLWVSIAGMSPPLAPLSSGSVDVLLNRLRDSLNSIT